MKIDVPKINFVLPKLQKNNNTITSFTPKHVQPHPNIINKNIKENCYQRHLKQRSNLVFHTIRID